MSMCNFALAGGLMPACARGSDLVLVPDSRLLGLIPAYMCWEVSRRRSGSCGRLGDPRCAGSRAWRHRPLPADQVDPRVRGEVVSDLRERAGRPTG